MNPLDARTPEALFGTDVEHAGPCEDCAPIHRNIVLGSIALGVLLGGAFAWLIFRGTTS